MCFLLVDGGSLQLSRAMARVLARQLSQEADFVVAAFETVLGRPPAETGVGGTPEVPRRPGARLSSRREEGVPHGAGGGGCAGFRSARAGAGEPGARPIQPQRLCDGPMKEHSRFAQVY